jgi:hypothetical protein
MTQQEALAVALKKRGHGGFDAYIGLEHRPVSNEKDLRSRSYVTTCACGAVFNVHALEVEEP